MMVNIHLGCEEKCGKLSVSKSNITEGEPVTFFFSVYPGKNVTWEKKVASTYKQLEDEKYKIVVLQDKRFHRLNILETDYSNNGEYRVNCNDTVSYSIYLNVGKYNFLKHYTDNNCFKHLLKHC
jgi:hypothetical protein